MDQHPNSRADTRLRRTACVERVLLLSCRPKTLAPPSTQTVCTSLVHITIATVGDLVTRQALQSTMAEACSSSLVRSWGVVNSERCRTDLSPACLTLLYTNGDTLVDGIFARWADGYTTGEVPRLACQAVGRCVQS